MSLIFTKIFKTLYLFLTCGGQKGKREQLDSQAIAMAKKKRGEKSAFSDDFIKDLQLSSLTKFYGRSNHEL